MIDDGGATDASLVDAADVGRDGGTDAAVLDDAARMHRDVGLDVGEVPCLDLDLGMAVGQGVYMGTTTGSPHDVDVCGTGASAPTLRIGWMAPTTESYVVDDFLSVIAASIAVHQGDCDGPILGCNDDLPAHVAFDAVAGTKYVIEIGDSAGDDGGFTLNIRPGSARETGAQCMNGEDDDHDSYVDCGDSDCASAPGCVEICGNGIDDNGDGLVDCDDRVTCHAYPGCSEICDNGVDDDGDGLVDCADPNCQVFPACTTSMPCFGYVCPGVAPVCIVCSGAATCVPHGGACH